MIVLLVLLAWAVCSLCIPNLKHFKASMLICIGETVRLYVSVNLAYMVVHHDDG